ncbi:MAG: hypothetical protein WEA10_05035 [Actinomycetota bacterium]
MRRFLLLDANAVVDYFLPDPAKQRRADRTRTIVEAVRNRAVDETVLLVPNVCIPEVFGVFAKHTLGGSWNPGSMKLDRRRHETVRRNFRKYLRHGTVFHQYELDRYHVLATDLITPVDNWYQIRRGKQARRQTMGGIDRLVIAMGIVLARLNGHPNVAIITSDLRMVKSVERARRLPPSTAKKLRLPERAEELGYRWRPEVYPNVIDLQRAPNRTLEDFFGRWPIPTRKSRGKDARAPAV